MTKQVDHNDKWPKNSNSSFGPEVDDVDYSQFLLDYSSIMLAAENARNDSSLVLTPTLHALNRPFPLIAAVTQKRHDS